MSNFTNLTFNDKNNLKIASPDTFQLISTNEKFFEKPMIVSV